MTQNTASRGAGRQPGASPWAESWALFAGVMMLIGGIMDVLYGIMGVAQDDILVRTPSYAYRLSVTSWGWVHIVLGVLLAVVGAGVLTAKPWARLTAIVVVALSAIGNFLSLPYAPLWSVILLAIDGFVIWGLSTPSAAPDRAV